MELFVLLNRIFLTLAGSHLYGTNVETSDIDKRGVCIPPPEVVLGFARNFDEQQVPGEDTSIYSLKKFMELASKCNPNIIELLFVPLEFALEVTPIWKRLYEHRFEFLSARAFHSFTGYAISELKKIETHRGWRMKPPTHKPTREEFGLTNESTGLKEFKGLDASTISPEVNQLVEAERQYRAASLRWDQYQKWLTERNPARFATEAKFGYDTKNAMHLIRLLRMGKEILTDGNLIVRRPDASELLKIRRGEWSYEKLMDYALPLKEEVEQIYKSKSYVVKEEVDSKKLSDLCAELHLAYWNR